MNNPVAMIAHEETRAADEGARHPVARINFHPSLRLQARRRCRFPARRIGFYGGGWVRKFLLQTVRFHDSPRSTSRSGWDALPRRPAICFTFSVSPYETLVKS